MTAPWHTAGRSTELARRFVPGLAGHERSVEVDQTNHSVVVDDRVIVKWMDPPAPLPVRGVDAHRHLAEVGFTQTPRLLGTEQVGGVLVASVSDYIAGATDGWTWYVDEFVTAMESTPTHEHCLQSAVRLGSTTATLHRALSTASSVIPIPATKIDRATERRRAQTLLSSVSGEVVDPAARAVIADRHEMIIETFGTLDDGPTSAGYIHDDLHIGQFLRDGDMLYVMDFDGNPLDPAIPGPRPWAVDVASLMQSIDHAGRVAQHRHPLDADKIDTLIARCTAAALAAYREIADDLLDEAVLVVSRVAQELHEMLYASRHLSRWMYAPIATLSAMRL